MSFETIAEDNSVVAENIKRILGEKGITQTALAQRAGYDQRAIYEFTRNRRIFRPIDLVKMSAVLGVEVGELFSGQKSQGNPHPQESGVKGYKVFNPDWTCKGKQYTCPGKFEEDTEIILCKKGMHFFRRAIDCFSYYEFDPKNHIAEIVAYGKVKESEDKCVTDKLEIVREIPWNELLTIVNTGKGCTGYSNSGSRNSGNYNSGYWNSGKCNSGNRNSGYWNSGNCNSGDCNSGDCNSGDWNKCDYSSGCFNTKRQKMHMFNKLSEWTYEDWLSSDARKLMVQLGRQNLKYISFSNMTDAEKKAHPEAKTTGGYLRPGDKSDAVSWWKGLSEEEKATIKAIPNFDREIFMEITGIDVEED